MQDNPNITDDTDTGSNTPYLDMEREDWELAFEHLKGTGYTAIKMGQNLRMLYKYLDAQLFKPLPIMDSLDHAMKVLFPYTDFHEASFEMFIRLTEGKLTHEEEQMLHALGMKF